MINFRAVKPGDTLVTMRTNMGSIQFLMFPEAAPKAVENFVTHAKTVTTTASPSTGSSKGS